MKKLLLILICLFVSFEVKSEEILFKLKCITPLNGITFDTRVQYDKDYIEEKERRFFLEDIILTLTNEGYTSDPSVINFKSGKEERKIPFISFKGRSFFFEDNKLTKFDERGYNIYQFHLTLDKMKLFFTRVVSRGLYGNPPFNITTSIYSTDCKNITDNKNPPIPKNISPELPNTG